MADVAENPHAGAAGTELQTISGLRALGHDVDAAWAPELNRRIRHGNLHYLLELPHAYRRTMLRRMSKVRYDVVHVNQPHGYAAARALCETLQPPLFVHRSHGFELRMEREVARWREQYGETNRSVVRRALSGAMARLLRHNCREIARWADGHIVSAVECAEYLCSELGVPADRVAVVPQAAADEFLRAPAEPISDARLRRVLYVGQLAFFKAPMIVASAMSAIARTRPDTSFTWVCSAEHHDEVRHLFDPSVVHRLQLLDWMPQRQLCDVYDEHGVFLFPSFAEGFGKAFLEAMARGLAVVATNNSGPRAVIRPNIDGVLVDAGDAEAVAREAMALMDAPERARATGAMAAVTARTYTWDRTARETEGFYRERIARKAHGA